MSWVIEDAQGDLSWEAQAMQHVTNPESRYSTNRARALLLAHNIQRKKPSSRGVWEVFLSGAIVQKRGPGSKKQK